MTKLLLSTALPSIMLAGCAIADNSAAMTARDQQRLAAELGNRVAGAPVRCLPLNRTQDMITPGGEILFRDGATIYRARTSGDCRQVGNSGYALVFDHTPGATSLCSGDFAKVVSTSGGMLAGSCAFEDFTPYRRP